MQVLASEPIRRYCQIRRGVDRLILLGARTVMKSAQAEIAGRSDANGFILSVSQWDPEPDNTFHSLTSAQCLSALQAYQSVVRRLDFAVLEPEDSARLAGTKRSESALLVRAAILRELGRFASSNIEQACLTLSSSQFGPLNPFTCAQTFRVLTPSPDAYRHTWWVALWGLFWALKRGFPAPELAPGAAIGDCEPTAFVTAKCLEAIDTFLCVIRRRHRRLTEFAALLANMKRLPASRGARDWTGVADVEADIAHWRRICQERLITYLSTFERDAALHRVFSALSSSLTRKLAASVLDADAVASEIAAQITNADNKREIEALRGEIERSEKALSDQLVMPLGSIRQALEILARVSEVDRAARADELQPAQKALDDAAGVVERLWPSGNPYARAIHDFIKRGGVSRDEAEDPVSRFCVVKRYWDDQAEAAKGAQAACNELAHYTKAILTSYLSLAGITDAEILTERLTAAAGELEASIRKLYSRIEDSVNWSRYITTRHLSYAQSGRWSRFDAGELAWGTLSAIRFGLLRDVRGILGALETVAAAQRDDGTWVATRPFSYSDAGAVSYLYSVEVGLAVATTLNLLEDKSDELELDREDVRKRLRVVEASLERLAEWLTASGQRVVCLESPRGSFKAQWTAFGWCSDRAIERDRIHLAVTANAVEFLIEFRRLLQRRINRLICESFSTYMPGGFRSLDDVESTDLGKDYADRFQPQLIRLLREHVLRELEESAWLPYGSEGEEPEISSLILHGPPGTSKTMVARAIGRELGWRVVSLSPSDFLASGAEYVEQRAREIFGALEEGQRLLYFFDEIDELLLGREFQGTQRSVFSFLTPSFLTKLQDLHDRCRANPAMFVIATNYIDRIDAAAKRRGRIDSVFHVLYPDATSRFAIARRELEKGRWGAATTGEKRRLVELVVDATGLFSYNNLVRLCAWIDARGDDLASVEANLNAVKAGVDPSFKTEIDLVTFYSRRPTAAHEFVELLGLAPKRVNKVAIARAYWLSFPKRSRDAFREEFSQILSARGFAPADVQTITASS